MEFGEVIAGSVYGTTGYLAGAADLVALERVIAANAEVLQRFAGVVVATNYGDAGRDDLVAANARLWHTYVSDAVLLDSPINRGHSIGTSDLDNLLFDHCKARGVDWLCKGANDVLLDEQVMAIPVRAADFYYLNAVSYDALRQHDFGLELFASDDFFFPQTTFYAINVAATDFLVDREFLDRSYAVVGRIPDYNGRIWEYIPGWTCEHLLRQAVLRNGLTRCHLMSQRQWRQVLALVVERRITDCSFKGLAINGICHAHGFVGADAVPLVVL